MGVEVSLFFSGFSVTVVSIPMFAAAVAVSVPPVRMVCNLHEDVQLVCMNNIAEVNEDVLEKSLIYARTMCSLVVVWGGGSGSESNSAILNIWMLSSHKLNMVNSALTSKRTITLNVEEASNGNKFYTPVGKPTSFHRKSFE